MYAEDPRNGFLPSIGELAVWSPLDLSWMGVHEATRCIEFDPMLADRPRA